MALALREAPPAPQQTHIQEHEAPPTVSLPVPHDFVPHTAADLRVCLSDPMWRICSGQLYKIMIKGDDNDDDDDALVVPFKPNRAQRRLIKRMHSRNIILKARQLGFTTFLCIFFLDCTLFRPNVRAGIIAHEEDAAKAIFRDKVKFAYLNLPAHLREVMPLKRDAAEELLFAHNNSSIRVSTSMRSGTMQYLHISEFGKICAKRPDRAEEVVRGSIPTVPTRGGMLFIESTAEGRDGHFYKMTTKAEQLAQLGRRLTPKEYRFHFFPWWQESNYRMDPEGVVISRADHEYFDKVEGIMGCSIDIEQRAWWIATRDNDFSGEEESMWQEYPSTPAEAFQVSNKGCYYAVQMAKVRKEKRLTRVPFEPGYPVNTFWDIGAGDGTAIWFHQQVGVQHRFINFVEGWGEPYAHFVKLMQEYQQETGCVWGRHYLPHDGTHEKQGETNNNSPRTMLENLGLTKIEIVPRISEIQHGIQATRDFLASCWFDEEGCKEGVVHIETYKKKWSNQLQTYTDEPLHDIHSEASDALRQAAQTFTNTQHSKTPAGKRPKRRNRGGLAA
ncbi:putative terminase large subunit [Erwinia phage PEp14]|uniref:Putative terminase large subunit n=1 Tax=Erwinia phage PEp14 TaxID=1131315 RepID=H2DE33_9CAUD|nr:putative terminase large subunit [Erwinia phage PEp14]AEY69590.1 putative terminase large subunit [Erwinia phage PEp14]